MIPAQTARSVQSRGLMDSAEFGISLEDSAHIMTILRDTLYSDKILAVLREYSANAWDANREAGRGDKPIKVTLPTYADPTLTIRDYGPGLSREGIFKVYTQYGKSTKRDSNEAVGMLGIGSKSGFAYADSFTITSWHGGKKAIYSAVLDASEKGVVQLLHEETLDRPETGVEVSIAVESEDCQEFKQKAIELFKYFNPRPQINAELPEPPPELIKMESGAIYDGTSWQFRGWVAVMGCVPYRINLDQVIDYGKNSMVPEFVRNLCGALYFDIGEVHINASREELKYSTQTKKAIAEKFNRLLEDYVRETLRTIDSTPDLTPFARRLRMQFLSKFHPLLPPHLHKLTDAQVHIPDNKQTKTFVLRPALGKSKDSTRYITARPDLRFIIRDDNRTKKGFQSLGYHDLLVTRERLPGKDGALGDYPSWTEMEKELNELLAALELTGAPVVKLSTLPWTAPARGAGGQENVKHKLKAFKWNGLTDSWRFKPPYSDFWVPAEWEPSDEDIFVEVNAFKVQEYSFPELYAYDAKLAALYGIQMPTVYAYKVKDGNQGLEKRRGHEYRMWHNAFIKKLLALPAFLKDVDVFNWNNEWEGDAYTPNRFAPDAAIYNRLAKELGDTHKVVTFVKHIMDTRSRCDSIDRDIMARLVREHKAVLKPTQSEYKKQLGAIKKAYPLFTCQSIGIRELGGQDWKKWTDYIKVMDERE